MCGVKSVEIQMWCETCHVPCAEFLEGLIRVVSHYNCNQKTITILQWYELLSQTTTVVSFTLTFSYCYINLERIGTF